MPDIAKSSLPSVEVAIAIVDDAFMSEFVCLLFVVDVCVFWLSAPPVGDNKKDTQNKIKQKHPLRDVFVL